MQSYLELAQVDTVRNFVDFQLAGQSAPRFATRGGGANRSGKKKKQGATFTGDRERGARPKRRRKRK